MSTLSKIQNYVGVTADGIWGRQTLAAVADALNCGATVKEIQVAVGVKADGIVGSKTIAAVADALNIRAWPSQAEVRSGKSIFGKAGDESNLVDVYPAYQMYYEGKPISRIRCHRKIAEDVRQVFEEVLRHYGLKRIHELGLDKYSGCYNNRSTVSGKSKSMHAWGIALDFAAETNAYSMKEGKATLSKPECEEWWRIWERHGAVSLGRQRNYDWMHVQFATL